MDFLERDLEDILFEGLSTPDGVDSLHKRGLSIYSELSKLRVLRQLRIGNYGVCDLITISRIPREFDSSSYLDITIFELKLKEINIKTLNQIRKYEVGVVSYLQKRGIPFRINLCIVGRRLNGGDEIYLYDKIDNLGVFIFKYTMDGIAFTRDKLGYILTEEGF